jgi:hypothetical protein
MHIRPSVPFIASPAAYQAAAFNPFEDPTIEVGEAEKASA